MFTRTIGYKGKGFDASLTLWKITVRAEDQWRNAGA
jgi:hypothetical protein